MASETDILNIAKKLIQANAVIETLTTDINTIDTWISLCNVFCEDYDVKHLKYGEENIKSLEERVNISKQREIQAQSELNAYRQKLMTKDNSKEPLWANSQEYFDSIRQFKKLHLEYANAVRETSTLITQLNDIRNQLNIDKFIESEIDGAMSIVSKCKETKLAGIVSEQETKKKALKEIVAVGQPDELKRGRECVDSVDNVDGVDGVISIESTPAKRVKCV